MHSNKSNIGHEDGFTLIEVLIALVIFLVISLGLAAGQISALLTHRDNVFRDEALRLAEEELDRLKSEQFTLNSTAVALNATAWVANQQVSTPIRSTTTSFQRTFQITDVAAAATAMKRIDVAVGWNMGNNAAVILPTGLNHQVTLSTVITRAD